MTATTLVDWAAARRAVADTAPRVSALVRDADRPDAPALGDWDVTQLAVHVSHVADAIAATTKGGGNLVGDIWDLGVLNRVMVEGEGRRRLDEMADRLDATVAGFLGAMEAAGEDTSHAWFVRGTELPLSALTCHLLNELVVHGYDLARALGVPWPIERSHAALIVQGFLFPALHTLGRALVVQEKAGEVRARFDVRLRGGGRAWLHLCHGDVVVETSPQGPVDCHLSVDPAAFLLVSWGRISQWPAIARGRLLAWGRKPWLGPQLKPWVRNP